MREKFLSRKVYKFFLMKNIYQEEKLSIDLKRRKIGSETCILNENQRNKRRN